MSDLTDIERARIEEVWRDFWYPLLATDDALGISMEAVKAELFDYHTCIQEVSKVYDHVTWGKLSKPNTIAAYVIQEHDAQVERAYREGYRDAMACCGEDGACFPDEIEVPDA